MEIKENDILEYGEAVKLKVNAIDETEEDIWYVRSLDYNFGNL